MHSITNVPFALAIYLMLRERDVLMVEVDTHFGRNLTKVFVCGPLYIGVRTSVK